MPCARATCQRIASRQPCATWVLFGRQARDELGRASKRYRLRSLVRPAVMLLPQLRSLHAGFQTFKKPTNEDVQWFSAANSTDRLAFAHFFE